MTFWFVNVVWCGCCVGRIRIDLVLLSVLQLCWYTNSVTVVVGCWWYKKVILWTMKWYSITSIATWISTLIFFLCTLFSKFWPTWKLLKLFAWSSGHLAPLTRERSRVQIPLWTSFFLLIEMMDEPYCVAWINVSAFKISKIFFIFFFAGRKWKMKYF